MSDNIMNSFNGQVESLFLGPAKAYAGLAVDHFENVANFQYDAARTYADIGLQRARAVLDIKDASGLKDYVESQQKFVQTIGEQVRGDVEKIAALNRDFVAKVQKLSQDSVKNVSVATKGQ